MKELLYLSHSSFRPALPCTDYIYPIGIKFHRKNEDETATQNSKLPCIFFQN